LDTPVAAGPDGPPVAVFTETTSRWPVVTSPCAFIQSVSVSDPSTSRVNSGLLSERVYGACAIIGSKRNCPEPCATGGMLFLPPIWIR
jgi:hypothetical protein